MGNDSTELQYVSELECTDGLRNVMFVRYCVQDLEEEALGDGQHGVLILVIILCE